MTGIQRAVLGEALQEAIGGDEVRALLLTTHDLDPQFLEAEILPVFLGNTLQHTQRTRQVQLEHEIRGRDVDIDVYYEGRALAAHEGAARLGWSRLRMTGRRGGVFHPKVVLALCSGDQGESLIVSVASANLTRGGWWTNLEVADVVRLNDGQRHGYLAGLKALVKQLDRAAPALANRSATKRVAKFLARQEAYSTITDGGTLRPTLLPGWTSMTAELGRLFGNRLAGSHLEVITPFHDADPLAEGSALIGLIDQFRPRSTTIALPMLGVGTPLPQAVFDRIAADDRIAWGRIPTAYTRLADGVDAGDRSVHAKVYRFWRGGSEPFEVLIAGSHNLSGAAHSGTTNFEVSVIHELRGRRQQPFLERADDRPDAFDVLDPEEEAQHTPSALPLSLAYDWESGQASARWDAGTPPQPVVISRAGESVVRVDLQQRQNTVALDAQDSGRLREVLMSSCVVTATIHDGSSSPLLLIELNHDLKPLLTGMTLTPAELLALWAIPDLRSRLEKAGRLQGERGPTEPDLDGAPPATVSMFEQFAGVYHAFQGLKTRIGEMVAAGRVRAAAVLLYGRGLDSPCTVLELVRDQADDDLALAYVTFRCARHLLDAVETDHQSLATELPRQRQELIGVVAHHDRLRRALIESAAESERAELEQFLVWFDDQFDTETQEVTTEATP